MRRSLLRPARSKRGMTLLEVAVAIAIIVIMAVTVAETLRHSVEFNRLLGERDTVTRQARVALSKIRRDLQLAFLTPHQTVAERYLTVFVGLDREPDMLFFSTLSHQRIYRDSRECDQAEVTIWAENAPSNEGGGYVLYHRESQRIDEEPDEGGVVNPLAYNVRSFRLRYFDAQKQEWVHEWDTRSSDTPYRLPRAVEVALVLFAPDPEDARRTIDIPFVTTVQLEYGERIPTAHNPFGAAPPLAGAAGNPLFNPMARPGGGAGPGRGGPAAVPGRVNVRPAPGAGAGAGPGSGPPRRGR